MNIPRFVASTQPLRSRRYEKGETMSDAREKYDGEIAKSKKPKKGKIFGDPVAEVDF